MMKTEDFQPSEIFDYEITVKLWGRTDVHAGVDCDGRSLGKLIPKIEKLLTFLDDSREKITEALLKEGYLATAEDWASSAAACEDKEDCYIMEDGAEVQLPITAEDFATALEIDCLSIDFNEKGEAEAGVYLVCEPDYFAGHCIEIELNGKGGIEILGIAG